MAASKPAHTGLLSNRWTQLVLGVIAMMAISSPQYVWALFTGPLTAKFGVSLASVQITFSLLIVLQTFFSPFQAYLVDRFGARLLISVGALLSGGSWMLASRAESVQVLYLTYGIVGGIGTGIIYVGIIGLMVKWFPDKRGLATGLAAMGYGAGAVITSFPIDGMIKSSGYAATLLTWGAIQAVIGILAAQGLRTPSEGWMPKNVKVSAANAELQSRRSFSPSQMLKSPIFYLMFVMMTMMSTGGLMMVSNIGAFAKEYGIANVLVFGVLAALPLALTVDRITNGLTRPFFGWVSDRIGREKTMALAFSLEGIAIVILYLFISSPLLFVVLTGVVFFGWGEIFSLFPSTLTDTFGPKYASTNYGFLYIAQGVGSLLGAPFAAWLKDGFGSWSVVFALVAVLDVVTAVLAVTVLRGMRKKHLAAR
jgi:MFS transporter, OFA family, oxalate/formate antiporter